MTFSALLLNRPIVLIYDFTPSTPEGQHRCGRIGHRIEFGCRFVDAYVGGLCRKQDGNQQLEWRTEMQFGSGVGIVFPQPR